MTRYLYSITTHSLNEAGGNCIDEVEFGDRRCGDAFCNIK